MKLYFIELSSGIITPYHSSSIEGAQSKAQAIADKNNEIVAVYEQCLSVYPSMPGIDLAEKHLDDIIHEPERTASNVITNRPSIHPSLLGSTIAEKHINDIIEEPSRTIKIKRATCKPYEEIQRKNEFVQLYVKNEELYNNSATLRNMADAYSFGASIVDVITALVQYNDHVIHIKGYETK